MNDRVKQFIEEIQREKIVRKNLYDKTWLSGSSTMVYPIFMGQNEIVLQWKSNRRLFDSFILRMVNKYNDIIENGYFWASDGSCPSTITFKLK